MLFRSCDVSPVDQMMLAIGVVAMDAKMVTGTSLQMDVGPLSSKAPIVCSVTVTAVVSLPQALCAMSTTS